MYIMLCAHIHIHTHTTHIKAYTIYLLPTDYWNIISYSPYKIWSRHSVAVHAGQGDVCTIGPNLPNTWRDAGIGLFCGREGGRERKRERERERESERREEKREGVEKEGGERVGRGRKE